MTRGRCPVCDRIIATADDARRELDGPDAVPKDATLCWADVFVGPQRTRWRAECVGNKVDWRARACAAETAGMDVPNERFYAAEFLRRWALQLESQAQRALLSNLARGISTGLHVEVVMRGFLAPPRSDVPTMEDMHNWQERGRSKMCDSCKHPTHPNRKCTERVPDNCDFVDCGCVSDEGDYSDRVT